MKLWILRPKGKAPYKGTAWEKPWDKRFGFIVRARDEFEARHFASTGAGDEGSGAWLDAEQSSCIELTTTGDKGIVMRDGING